MLQALNILENVDVKALGYNSAAYVHALYQAMNLAFADRDFYYGDPYTPPEEPIGGLLSKEYARQRATSRSTGRSATTPTPSPATPIPSRAARTRSSICSRQWTPIPPGGRGRGRRGSCQQSAHAG